MYTQGGSLPHFHTPSLINTPYLPVNSFPSPLPIPIPMPLNDDVSERAEAERCLLESQSMKGSSDAERRAAEEERREVAIERGQLRRARMEVQEIGYQVAKVGK